MQTSKVDAWLADIRSPAPSPIDLATYVARVCKDQDQRDSKVVSPAWADEAMKRLAMLAIELDAQLRTCRAAAVDASMAAQVTIGRLQQQEKLVAAARAWREDHDDGARIADLAAQVENYEAIVKARS